AHGLARTGSTDVSYSLPSRTRFRVNIFQQRGTYSIVMRVIPTEIPTLEALSLPAQLADIADLKNGIVLVTGPTGSGKSSTLAAVLDRINETKAYHTLRLKILSNSCTATNVLSFIKESCTAILPTLRSHCEPPCA